MQKKSELESNIKYNNKVSSEMSNLLQNFKSIPFLFQKFRLL